MSLQSLLGQDTITVKSSVISKDASGGSTRTFADLYTGVDARVWDASASEIERYLQRGMEISHFVQTQQDGILEQYLIITSDGRTLIVQAQRKVRTMGGIDTYYEYPCIETRIQES